MSKLTLLLRQLHPPSVSLILATAIIVLQFTYIIFSHYNAPPSHSSLPHLALLEKTFHIIKLHYANHLSDQDLMYGAISGMLSKLDKHSKLIAGQKKQSIHELSGYVSDLGLTVSREPNGFFIVNSIKKNSPAASSDLTIDDQILSINKTSLQGKSLTEVHRLIHSRAGEAFITLLVQDSRFHKPTSIQIPLHKKPIKSIQHKIIQHADKQYAFIGISRFHQNTDKELLSILNTLEEKLVSGIILDLRNNPGGIMASAINIADQFLSSGKTVTIHSLGYKQPQTYHARQGAILHDLPIVILTNTKTASSAEILAMALTYNNRALIVGNRSKGKGSIQSVYTLDEYLAIKLTTGYYTRPDGRKINGVGIDPNVTIAQTIEASDSRDYHIEKALQMFEEKDYFTTLESSPKVTAHLQMQTAHHTTLDQI